MRKKILVIDNEEIIADMLKENLEQMGYETSVATSGLEGIRKAEAIKPDFITLDIMMAGLSGMDTLQRLKNNAETKDIPIILISIAGDIYKKTGLRLGAIDVLKKPLDFKLLDKKIRAATQKKRIMVVDDDKTILELMEIKLKTMGYEFRGASDGETAIMKAKKEKPDIILIDIVLPGRSGIDVIKELKKDPGTADIPIIAFSGYISDELEGREIIGADKFLGKKFSSDELAKEISKILNGN